ncbi:MAG TPA: DUF3501 family protein [Gemmataceae bacterium]|nr:DUF3501 family protein [Gemmataceae bacterium]
MRPLTLDDLLPLEEFAAKRREYFESHRRYLDQYRRVRIGPSATLVFENRQTLWFRVHEMLRIARLAEPQLVNKELDLFNRLLPGAGQLQAALLIAVTDESKLSSELAPWDDLGNEHLRLFIGQDNYAGSVLTCRPEDRCVGAVHWLQFKLDELGRRQLADFRHPAFVEITLEAYPHRSPALSAEIRQSLVDDLNMSDVAPQAAA